MKFFLAFLLVYGSVFKLSARSNSDSAAIYFTQQQFDENDKQLLCACRIKEKASPMWSDFKYMASGIIKIRKKGNTYQLFQPDSIYGFFMNGIKYRYINSEKRYLAVLAYAAGINFYIKVEEHIGYKFYSSNEVIFFQDKNNGTLLAFTKANIKKSFSDGNSAFTKMIQILEATQNLSGNLSVKNFFKCQQLLNKISF